MRIEREVLMSVVYLDSEDGKSELRRLWSILRHSYGPFGIAVMFQPSPGGHTTLTSLSQRLLSMLHTPSPVGRLLLSSLCSHSQLHKDAGLYAGLLSIDLILRGMELKFPRRQVAMVTSHALSLITAHLSGNSSSTDQFLGKRPLELSSMTEMTSLLRCLLCSKAAVSHLSNVDIDHLTSLLLHCFLIATPRKSAIPFAISERVHIHTSLGRPITQSCLLAGLLVEEGSGSGSSLSDGEAEALVERLRECGGEIVTALFGISLAGDLPDEFSRDIQLVTGDPSATGGRRDLEAVVLRRLMGVAGHLVEMGVRFVGCQKVIHPLLRDFWREKGVVTVDRLSSVNLGPVRDLTGGRIISSLTTGLTPDCLGRLNAIRRTSVHGKRYMVLEGGGGHCSLMLCCQTDSEADELRPLCSSALCILQQCLHTPYVLQGGGCTETQLSHFLLTKATDDCSSDLLKELQCNEKTFKAVMRSVATSFREVAKSLEHHGGTVLSDSSYHHCWFFAPEDCMEPLVGHEKHMTTEKTDYSSMTKDNGDRGDNGTISGQFAENRHNFQVSPLPVCCGEQVSSTERGKVSEGTSECGEMTGSRSKLRNEELPRRKEKWCVSEKACGCGCVRLSDLPSACEWIPLGDDKLSLYVSESIKECLKRAVDESAERDGAQRRSEGTEINPFPCVCDAFWPKLKAIEMANDLSSTLLRIAFSIEK